MRLDENNVWDHHAPMMISKLRTWRKNRKLTLVELSERTGLSVSHLCKIERGNSWPRPEVLATLEKTTRGAVSAADILSDFQASKRAS